MFTIEDLTKVLNTNSDIKIIDAFLTNKTAIIETLEDKQNINSGYCMLYSLRAKTPTHLDMQANAIAKILYQPVYYYGGEDSHLYGVAKAALEEVLEFGSVSQPC